MGLSRVLTCVRGPGQLISGLSGLQTELEGWRQGECVGVRVVPGEADGPWSPEAVRVIPLAGKTRKFDVEIVDAS